MSQPRSSVEVAPDIVLRAAAIVMVTFNHAHPYTHFALGFGGGMTFLMMLSGYNFAKFGMQGATPAAARLSLWRLGLKILVPSLIAVLFFFLLLRKFDLLELLFVRNWVTLDRVAKFPTWYPQVIGQMFAALILLFSIPKVAQAILRRPLAASLALFALGVVVRIVEPLFWNTTPLHQNLPQLFLWNFVLGWIVFFSTRLPGPPWRGKLLALACAVVGGAAGWGLQALDFWWLTVGTALLLLPMTLRVPTFASRLLGLVSQGTLAIFLLHRFLYEVYEHAPLPANQDVEWLFGLLGSLALWVAGASALRAFRALHQQHGQGAPPAPAAAAPA